MIVSSRRCSLRALRSSGEWQQQPRRNDERSSDLLEPGGSHVCSPKIKTCRKIRRPGTRCAAVASHLPERPNIERQAVRTIADYGRPQGARRQGILAWTSAQIALLPRRACKCLAMDSALICLVAIACSQRSHPHRFHRCESGRSGAPAIGRDRRARLSASRHPQS